ncbi:large ribosomal subunit protein mL41 isoform X2 [Callospermophilus lateralis]|uniref:large ribosomal subunit protein mL41 isoform X2 n=1 Tax=Callospermophilus lateralis TaxID=76772 RepID=UPI004054037A
MHQEEQTTRTPRGRQRRLVRRRSEVRRDSSRVVQLWFPSTCFGSGRGLVARTVAEWEREAELKSRQLRERHGFPDRSDSRLGAGSRQDEQVDQ